MIKIYDAANLSEAHIVRGMLEANGIEACVGGHYLQGGIGELAPQGFVSVHVMDGQVELARDLVREYERNGQPAGYSNIGKNFHPYSRVKITLIAIGVVLLFVVYYLVSNR